MNATVVFDTSISLDGYMTAGGRTADEPLGVGGEQLHEWTQDTEYLQEQIAALGAVITGRRNYDDSIRWWGADGPSGPARRPVFVVTHSAPATAPEEGVYQFVTDGIESALSQARAAAGDGVVTVMGGADVAQQYLEAGLVDELSIHVVPVLFGTGLPAFQGLDLGEHVQFELVESRQAPQAVHLRYRVRH
ncbi:dihydrofolate reductase family protein [Intrasporangium sp.]|jgi:dihydrofolate reductase|uniref:dihydrofolate reductase family protein n=1 Tax=Intrasporangium sp. TaxID=1925024 RepID=UPI0033658E25